MGRALIEGPTLFAEAVAAGAAVETVFHLQSDTTSRGLAALAGAEAVPVTGIVLERLATTTTPQSPVAVIAIPDTALPPDGDVLVAWGVGDPGNVGTLIRTAAAFGLAFGAGPGTADMWSPKVLRAGSGSHFRIPVARVGDLSDLAGRLVVATVAMGGAPGSECINVG